jgi:hypothetical protein
MKLYNFKRICLAFVFFLSTQTFVLAQGSDPMPPGATAEGVPIDGGVLGLLIAGGIYGAKKIHEQRKKSKVSE